LKKFTFEKHQRIYIDKEVAEYIYMIQQGTVKLFAENGYPFKIYKDGDVFGEADSLCGIRRNGTAIAVTSCQLYRATKSTIEEVLLNFPEIKRKIVE